MVGHRPLEASIGVQIPAWQFLNWLLELKQCGWKKHFPPALVLAEDDSHRAAWTSSARVKDTGNDDPR